MEREEHPYPGAFTPVAATPPGPAAEPDQPAARTPPVAPSQVSSPAPQVEGDPTAAPPDRDWQERLAQERAAREALEQQLREREAAEQQRALQAQQLQAFQMEQQRALFLQRAQAGELSQEEERQGWLWWSNYDRQQADLARRQAQQATQHVTIAEWKKHVAQTYALSETERAELDRYNLDHHPDLYETRAQEIVDRRRERSDLEARFARLEADLRARDLAANGAFRVGGQGAGGVAGGTATYEPGSEAHYHNLPWERRR